MQISINANRCEPSPMRKFHPLAVAAEQRGKKIYHLNIGQPDIATPSAYFEAVRKYDPQTLAYDASPGNPELIRAVQNYYAGLGVDLEPRDILITTGGSEALLLTCLSILDPYTEVIIPEPYYPNYTTFVHAAGGVIRALPTNPWEGYRYAKRERIESLITKNTRAILITNPGNPTGVVLDREEMRMIADIAKEHDLFLICDEVYREFCYDEKFGVPTMARFHDIDDNLVIIDSVSKRFSACGARVGCVVTKNPELQSALLKFCQSRLSVATIDQIGAAALYRVDPSFFRQCKGLTVASQMTAEQFVQPDTLLILALGLVAFVGDTVGGVLFAKLINLFLPEGKKINPMIGAAGISAFPMSGRVVNQMGLKEDNQNFLLMYSVSVNVSGQIASVIAGGLILTLMGV